MSLILTMLFIFIISFFSFFISRRSITLIFVWGAGVIFIIPFYYTVLGGETYRSFSDDVITPFFINSFLSILFILFTLISQVFFNKGQVVINYGQIEKSRNIELLAIFTIIICVIYFGYYFEHWPLLKVFSNDEWERPDIVKGAFKGFFFMSVIYQVILPSIFFYFYQKKQQSRIVLTLLFLFVSFFLIVGGNKGIYLYFILFYIFVARKKIPVLYMLGMLMFLIFFYAMMKGVAFDYETFRDYILESAFRRLFITQGMATPNALQMYYDSVDFSILSSDELKYALFYKIYGYSPGAMPLYFTIESFIRFGYLGMIAVGLFVSLAVSFITVLLERNNLLCVSWCGYYLFYVLIMSGIAQSNLYRAFVVILFSCVLIILFKNKREV